jgi:hypothetical protein
MRHGLLVAGYALLVGCAYWSGQERETLFDNTSRAYTRAMEWSNFEALGAFVRVPDGGVPFDPSVYKDFKITAYKPKGAVGNATSGSVQRVVQISYVWLPRMSERSIAVQEMWEYSEKDKRWFLTSGLPPLR